jgi:hypothetical protein
MHLTQCVLMWFMCDYNQSKKTQENLCLPAYSNLSLCVSYLYLPAKTSVVCVLSSVISTSRQPLKFATYRQVPAYSGQNTLS